MKQQKHTTSFLPLVLIGCLLLLLFFPAASIAGAKNGLILWSYQVIPSLLPFLILSDLFVSTGCSDLLARLLYPVLSPFFRCSGSGCYAIVMGFFSGLPVGAKTVSELVLSERISRREGSFLLPLCNNAGPSFVLGYLCITLLSAPDFSLEFLLILWGSAILSALLLRPAGTQIKPSASGAGQEALPKPSFSSTGLGALPKPSFSSTGLGALPKPSFSFRLLDTAIEHAFSLLLRIGGYIVLFSVVASLIRLLPLPPFGIACLCSLLEITTGASALSSLALPRRLLLPLLGAFVSFGGLCGIVQTKSALAGSNLPFAHYIRTRLLAALFAAVLLFLRVR